MREGLGVTFLDLWWAEFHAGKEVRAKLVGLPGSAVVSSKEIPSFDWDYQWCGRQWRGQACRLWFGVPHALGGGELWGVKFSGCIGSLNMESLFTSDHSRKAPTLLRTSTRSSMVVAFQLLKQAGLCRLPFLARCNTMKHDEPFQNFRVRFWVDLISQAHLRSWQQRFFCAVRHRWTFLIQRCLSNSCSENLW